MMSSAGIMVVKLGSRVSTQTYITPSSVLCAGSTAAPYSGTPFWLWSRINLGFGSGVVVEGAGFILNDEMDDFSAKPGVMNVFGAIGGKANEIQPHKRMLSSMTPTILLSNNKVKMVTGSPGGTTIISSVYQSILNTIEFNMSANEVVNSPRFHHQLWPKNVIRAHSGLESSVKQQLIKMGYTVDERHFGDMHVII